LPVLSSTSTVLDNPPAARSASSSVARAGIDDGKPPVTINSIADLQAIGVADVDGDGSPDLVGVNGFGTMIVHLGDGHGNFAGGTPVPLLGNGNPGVPDIDPVINGPSTYYRPPFREHETDSRSSVKQSAL
jgi:hypothetical protein